MKFARLPLAERRLMNFGGRNIYVEGSSSDTVRQQTAGEMTMLNSRKSPRLLIRLAAELKGFTPPEPIEFTNLSMAGAFIETSLPLNKGDYLSCQVTDRHDEHATMSVIAVVRRVHENSPCDVGVEFVFQTDSERKTVKRFIQKALCREFPGDE